MLNNEFYVIVFDSTHHAIQTEQRLRGNFKIETIPTPREITASCGLSIKFSETSLQGILNILKEEEKRYKVYKIERTGTHRNVSQIC
ncbi:MAG: DUF3343 domain-containing protein [Bacillota bacterium]